MSRAYSADEATIAKVLTDFHENIHPLKGLIAPQHLETLVQQIISSIRRVEYVKTLDQRSISSKRADPSSDIFCPLRAAIIHRNKGDMDEAMWLIFLATHFGKHAEDGWRLMRDIYGAFSTRLPWTWKAICADKKAFVKWAQENLPFLLGDGISRRFSNHRKYESKKPQAIIDALLAYIALIESYGGHRQWLIAAHKTLGQNPTEAFQYLYVSLDKARRLGRLGKFDFLTMVGKLNLMPVEPGIAYLNGATGPLRGVRLLVDGNVDSSSTPEELQAILGQLDLRLKVGMQVLEDSLCNWQKSPTEYVYFRG